MNGKYCADVQHERSFICYTSAHYFLLGDDTKLCNG